ncbi:MAG: prepilin-type N-terminal cleavage/methylation domain-containing protein [Proteobacteria bacterium]|nr:prepilin-type N-terminal cleavage/methylation domain-containing protein [Pseudomonadota bacterium]
MRVQEGFSLIEVLVALAVAALFFGILLPMVVTTLDRTHADASRAEALRVAQSQIEIHAVIAHDMGGRFEGRDGSFAWTATIDQTETGAGAQGAASSFALRRVRVDVFQERTQPIVSLEVYRVGVVR